MAKEHQLSIGFTGTRQGMTEAQKAKVRAVLYQAKPTHVHHGDCVGADFDFHELCVEYKKDFPLIIIGHPPEDSKYRAYCTFDKERGPKPYKERNHDIVDESKFLIATPAQNHEVLRSGTWATIRYARRRSQVVCVNPGGKLI